jgi:hypothetical protein
VPFDLADTVRLAADSKDVGGTLSNATTVTLTLTLPDGTTTSPAVTNPPAQTGRYTYDYTTVQAGRHLVRWVFTTPNNAYTDAFDVREAAPPLIVSLADAKTHLNITSTTHDEELRGWIESVTRGVEHLAGACVRRTVTERHDVSATVGALTLALRKTPALSLTSVVAILDGGTDYMVADLDLDGETGIVQRLDGGRMVGPLRVTYTAGRAVIPATITSAAKIILQHLWRTQHPAGRPSLGGEDYSVTEQVPGFGYAIPNRALQLLEPDRLPPGVA